MVRPSEHVPAAAAIGVAAAVPSTISLVVAPPPAVAPPAASGRTAVSVGRPAEPDARQTTLPDMDRRSALVLLAVLGAGVFLAGLELMVTAVALPSILADLADPNGGSAWIELRKASWIINGYLLVYILTMPMAGRLADLWGVRRLFMGALVVFIVRLGAGRRCPDARPAHRGAARPGGRRRRARPGRDGRRLAPVRRRDAAAGARRRRRPDVPRHGRRAGRRGGDPRLGPPRGRAGRGGRRRRGDRRSCSPAWRWVFYLNVPIGIIALALAWAASPGWETPAATRPGRCRRARRCSASRSSPGSSG